MLIQICDIFSIIVHDILLHKKDSHHIERTSNKIISYIVSEVSGKVIPDTVSPVMGHVHTRQYLFQNLECHYTANPT